MKILDILNAPWVIEPEKLQTITEIYGGHLRGEKVDFKAIEAQVGRPLDNTREGPAYQIIDGVAVVDVQGVLSKRMNMFTKISGGTSTELLGRDVRAAVADSRVHAIVLNIDSPGGQVDGTQAVADQIFAARAEKPVVAYVDGMMCSGACWIGTAAHEVYLSGDTAITGSIGVVMQHVDYSKAEERMGVKTTEVYAGKYKRIDSSYGPLSQEGRDYLQSMVDQIYTVFVNAVARNRGAGEDVVLKEMADGRLFIGRKAVEIGLVDGVSTLEALVADIAAGRKPKNAVAPGR